MSITEQDRVWFQAHDKECAIAWNESKDRVQPIIDFVGPHKWEEICKAWHRIGFAAAVKWMVVGGGTELREQLLDELAH